MDFSQNIQWFPGHMAKAKRIIKERLRLVDLAIEIIDSRIPISSRNPDFDEIFQNKPHIILLNKSDLSDQKLNSDWVDFFKSANISAVSIDCKTSKSAFKFIPIAKKIIKKDKIRCSVLGIPNVGKSSFINKILLRKKTKVENKPATTRSLGWFTAKDGIEFLDTPGLLWPKFDDEEVGENLAIVGSINSKVIDSELLCTRLIQKLLENYKKNLEKRFKLNLDGITAFDALKAIGEKRGMIVSKGEVDITRTSNMILEEFRSAKFGRITLERPNGRCKYALK